MYPSQLKPENSHLKSFFLPIVWWCRKYFVTLSAEIMAKRKLTRKDRQELYANMSKFCVDIAKLVIAGVILAGILKEDVDIVWLIVCGFAVVLVALAVAYNMFVMCKR